MSDTKMQPKPWVPLHKSPHITFTDVNIVDVEAGEVLLNQTVHIYDGLIRAITSSPREDASDFSSADLTVNLKGKFLLPGLIDCHVHLTASPGAASMSSLFSTTPTTNALRSTYTARTMLLRGFTTARDTGGGTPSLRDAIAEGLIPGPRLFVAGKALSQTGGHGDLRGGWQGSEAVCCGGHAPGLARVCDGVPACLEAARDELRQGTDFLKIMVGGGVASPADPIEMVQFTGEEIKAITTTATQKQTYVTAHAYTVEAIRHAVDNGVMGIEHGNFVDEETARYLADKGVTVTPTLITYKGMSETPFDQFLDETSQRKNQQVLARGFDSLRILSDAGVTLCYGSDLLSGMHALQTGEFALRARVLTPLQILQSATVNAAKLVGMNGRLGVVREGAIADLLVLDGNPLEDIGMMDRVENLLAIVKEGRVVASKIDGLVTDSEIYGLEITRS